MSRYTKSERLDAVNKLKEWIKPGAVVYTNLRGVSRSGMLRKITVHLPLDGGIADVTWLVARAIGYTLDGKTGGLKVGGCGMDMGFHVVYSLAYALFREGFYCVGPENGCPANDHNNGDKVERGGKHSDPGYALRHEWI